MHIALAGSCRSHESVIQKKPVNSSPLSSNETRNGFEDAHNNKIISHKVSSIFYVFGINCFHVSFIDVRSGELSLKWARSRTSKREFNL